jgi:thymidylate synthase
MQSFETQYLNLVRDILDNGEKRDDRTGFGTQAVFGRQLQFDVSQHFPLITTKRVPFKSVLSELLWFIEGSSDERRLAEILHGSRDLDKKTIWSPNAESTTGSKYKPEFYGDLGRVYGKQWRSWVNTTVVRVGDDAEWVDHGNGTETHFNATVQTRKIDQLADIVDKLKNKHTDRRIIMTAWNPGELDQMALPPCHMFCQFYLTNNKVLHCQMYQRSVDTFLGLPFNIASYALLMYIVADQVGATPGVLTMCLGDTHLYLNSIDGAKEMLARTPCHPPTLKIAKAKDINSYKMSDFVLQDYQCHSPIKVEMAS